MNNRSITPYLRAAQSTKSTAQRFEGVQRFISAGV
jgi:hypothetical protein